MKTMNIILLLFIIEIESTRYDNHFKNNFFDVSKFNYKGKCKKSFISIPNNERDLVISGLYYPSKLKWLKQKEQTLMVWSITQKGIPNAKKVVFLYGDEPEEVFVDTFKELGIEIIQIPIEHKKGKFYNAAV